VKIYNRCEATLQGHSMDTGNMTYLYERFIRKSATVELCIPRLLSFFHGAWKFIVLVHKIDAQELFSKGLKALFTSLHALRKPSATILVHIFRRNLISRRSLICW
jgi:hypothetical protein